MIGPVAQLMAVIGLNTAPLEAGIAKSTGMLAATGPLAVAALGAGAIVAGVGVFATKMAGDFQAGINSLETGAGELHSNLGLVSNGILQIAKDTGTSTQQAIAGMYMIESGGYHGAAGLKILQAAAEGARVGNADLGVTAEALDTVLKNYPDTINGANGAMNALIATVSHGKTHMEDLAGSLAQVLPTAASAGVGLNDVMGAMATMTAEGVPAAEAATYLRQTIIALASPTGGAQKALESFGLTSVQVGTEMQKSLPGAMTMITDAVAKKFPIGSVKYLAAMRDIMGGMRQMQGGLDLGGTHLKMFNDNVKAVADQVTQGGQSIKGWALTQQNFNTQVARAREVVETLMISLGQKLLPALTNVFKGLSDNLIPALQHFKDFMSGSSDKANVLEVALIALAGAIVANLVVAFYAWATAAGAAAVATIAATWPILAIGAVLGLLAAGIIFVVQHWKQLTAAGSPLAGILLVIQPILGKIGDLFGLLGRIWTTQILPALAQLLPILKVVGIVIGIGLLAAVAMTIGIFLLLVTAITGIILGITKFVQAIVWLITHIGDIQKAVQNWAHDLATNVTKKFMDFQAGLMKWGHDLAAGVVNWFKNLQQGVEQKAHDIAAGVTSWFMQLQKNIEQTAHDLVANFIKKMVDFENGLIQKGHDLVTGFLNALSSLPGKMLALGEQLIKQLAQGINNARSSVVAAVSNIPIIGGIAGQINSHIPHFASGGVMPYSGLAAISDNETVILPGGSQVLTPRQALAGGLGGYGGGGGQPIVINVQIDGRTAAQAIVPHMPGVIRAGTGRRNF